MSQEAVEKVLGRLLTDDAFRRRAGKSLSTACRDEGYQVTSEEAAAITPAVLTGLEAVAIRLDKGIKRFSCS